MVGDGVNDVPALKSSRLAIAQGSGTQMARSVSDLVLISGDFAAVPQLVAEGRRALRNLARVTKLYVTKSAFAAFLILTIGTSSEAYPLLPRHLSLAASLTIGIPTFFLALAPSSGPWRPERFVRGVAQFAIPAGTVIGTGLVSGLPVRGPRPRPVGRRRPHGRGDDPRRVRAVPRDRARGEGSRVARRLSRRCARCSPRCTSRRSSFRRRAASSR